MNLLIQKSTKSLLYNCHFLLNVHKILHKETLSNDLLDTLWWP